MLQKIRIIVAIVFFTAVTLLFLDFTGTLHRWLGWTAKIQFIPVLLALNASAVITLVALTLLLGRVYCSVICPLGVFQDVVSWFASKKKKNRFTYSPALSWLRYGVLSVFIVLFTAGIHSAVALLEPYSAYGRIASNLFAPFYQWGNNLLAYFAGQINSYAFYPVEVWLPGLAVFVAAALIFTILLVLAWKGGRTYCNTVCPVGTTLGLISRIAIFKPVIDADKCNGCSLCARNCKASCINAEEHSIDHSRCVVCMNCLSVCRRQAISYTVRTSFGGQTKTPATKLQPTEISIVVADEGASRRKFLSFATLTGIAVMAKAQQQLVADGGLADIAGKQEPERTTPIIPPGSRSALDFAKHCVGCQLCVSVCPSQILRPSGGLLSFMQPVISYERGYCRPECTKCSDVCPTAAIRPLTAADKSATKIGTSRWAKERCVVITDKQPCDNCARHCPVSAITMIDNPDEPPQAEPPSGRRMWGPPPKKRLIPIIDEEKCIGCGACENLCPARPLSAIWVEGTLMHRTV